MGITEYLQAEEIEMHEDAWLEMAFEDREAIESDFFDADFDDEEEFFEYEEE